jgi:hypothetical protein
MRSARLLLPALALPAVIAAAQSPAEALITVNFFDDGPNLKLTASGSLSQLPTPLTSWGCGNMGGYISGELQAGQPSYRGAFCSGSGTSISMYRITGPTGFGGNNFMAGTSASGHLFALVNSLFTDDPLYTSTVGIDTGYTLGTHFSSQSIFAGTSIANQGLVAGFTGIYTINGTSETIRFAVAPPAVPGPLPLLGAGAAFAWSRQLRKRTTTS